MPVYDALISVEEIANGIRGYIIADSPRQYVEVVKKYWYECCDDWPKWVKDRLTYDWYFGQEDWEFLRHGEEAVPPIPDMTIGGGYWVFMERDDTLAGFSNTPVFLSLTLEQHEDLDCVPRYPGTTMLGYEDWTDWEAFGNYFESRWGLQWAWIEYKGVFAVEDVLDFYEEQMPVCGWQMGSKFILDGDVSGIGFWREAEHGGVPYFTDVCRILTYKDNDIGYIRVFYNPVDVPTVPGTALIMWESMWPTNPMYLEYKGSVVPQEGINYFMEAMSKLQWEADDFSPNPPHSLNASFHKPWVSPEGPVMLYCNVHAESPQGLPWSVEQPVIISVQRGVVGP